MLTIIGLALIGVGTITTYALCKAAAIENIVDESRRQTYGIRIFR